MFINKETRIFDDYIENIINITNDTEDVLNNIELFLDPITLPLLKCKVTRERGSLEFPLPLSTVELGNLYPNESANIYCHIDSNTSTTSIETLKISYSTSDSKSVAYSFDFDSGKFNKN